MNVNGIEELVTDKGYHSGAVVQRVKSYEVRSYIPEKQQKGRRNWQGKAEAAGGVCQSAAGTGQLRQELTAAARRDGGTQLRALLRDGRHAALPSAGTGEHSEAATDSRGSVQSESGDAQATGSGHAAGAEKPRWANIFSTFRPSMPDNDRFLYRPTHSPDLSADGCHLSGAAHLVSARAFFVVLPQPASGTAVTTTQWDATGRPLTVTDGGGGTTTYAYSQNDVLVTISPAPPGENTKARQYEYDGLGRLTSVCEITSASGSGSCGQSNPATGFLTQYTYDALGDLLTITQNAQPGAIGGTQTRKYTYDGLSRLLSETNPEWGPGTANYAYDVACGTFAASAGDLTTKVDNAGNTSCYGHDALHRVTDVMVYEAGACYPPVKRFRYDNTVNAILPVPSGYPTGTSSNAGGRMVEAWTGDCVWPTPSNGSDSATDEWFAYSVRGEMTDLWESTAHIDGYYHGTASYAANGALASVGGVPGYTAVTYGVDGEGRLNTATQGTTDLVTAAAFTAGSQVKTISLGNGDQDSYLYDANTDRMTNYTFTVNGATDSGALTWNSNWTLAQLAITDGLNSGGTQTCTYSGYDDFGRLGSAICGSAWSQAFSYDPFGNITKSGSSAWAPGYNEATNQALPPITYDKNGNMTNDTLRTYAYYVDNKLGSINSTTCTIFGSTDGTCILYDAFGREVERGINGAYNEVMYTPVGKTAIMNGETTTVSAYFPLPGGATYYQSGSTGANQYFWHKDWLGSARLSSSITSRSSYFDRGFAPFGESYNNFGNAAGLDFTGDTQDSFAGLLYDTPTRELHPGQGRWLSPDPSGLAAVNPTNPQSWNRYAYVLNNPLSFTDPLGLSCDDPHDGQPCIVTVSGQSNDVPLIEIPWAPEQNGLPSPRGNQLLEFLRRLKAANNGTPQTPQKTPCAVPSGNHLSMGASVQVATVNPFTSGGGGVWARISNHSAPPRITILTAEQVPD